MVKLTMIDVLVMNVNHRRTREKVIPPCGQSHWSLMIVPSMSEPLIVPYYKGFHNSFSLF